MRLRPALALIVAASVPLTACASSGGGAPAASSPAASSSPVAGASTSPTPSASTTTAHAPSAAAVRAASAAAVARIIRAQPSGGVSVAALNTATGAAYHAGASSGMWTASAYKLLMVVTLLIENGSLSDSQYDNAQRALENSDNVAGYSLYESAGGTSGVEEALERLGMSDTKVGNSDPTFTTTSGSDYLKLLKALTDYGAQKGVLSSSARSTVLGMMRDVESDQRWGVGVVADKGTDFANKNGWLSIDDSNGPGETDNGLWAVTSVGIVTVKGQRVLMAVFTRHQSDFRTGVNLVQKLAKAMIGTVSPAA